MSKSITQVQGKGKNSSVKRLTRIAILSAIAALLMYFEFPLPFAPPFIKMDISEVPVLIAGFALGPLAGFITVALKLVIKMMLKGSITFGVGELSNLIVSSAFVVSASFIYQRNKTAKQALWGLIIGTFVMSLVATVSNTFVIFPMYMKALGKGVDEIVTMSKGTNPFVTSYTSLMLFSIFPFNMLKGFVDAIITMFVYKPISKFLKG